MTNTANYALKEDIRLYWSARAATFDASPGHGIHSRDELDAWIHVLNTELGTDPLHVLDLACGTGEVTRALLAAGHRVTGIDFSADMLEIAKAKHGSRADLYLCDAERLMESDNTFDAAITRHLVWTLTDPAAALAEWHRVLKPGGRLLIIDGNWLTMGLMGRGLKWLAEQLRRRSGAAPHAPDALKDKQAHIMANLPFRQGVERRELAKLLVAAGFSEVRNASYTPILRAQQRHAPLHDALRLEANRRFALLATK
jgi:ubiquinone/menaquinone biosynthesis C-methylase UbiE